MWLKSHGKTTRESWTWVGGFKGSIALSISFFCLYSTLYHLRFKGQLVISFIKAFLLLLIFRLLTSCCIISQTSHVLLSLLFHHQLAQEFFSSVKQLVVNKLLQYDNQSTVQGESLFVTTMKSIGQLIAMYS